MNRISARKLSVAIALSIILACNGCKPEPRATWSYSETDVTGVPPAKSDQINMDVYIDATTSMEGFAVGNSSNYSQFLDQVEASALSAWKNADAKYFKFGEIIKPVNRTEFLSAKNDLQFYHERGVFMKTYIDSVVNRTDPSRLSVLITDLFQDEGDVNTMVDKFKNKCFARGVIVGIVGVKSDFKGKVFDVRAYPSGYQLDSKERPFYAIIFGNQYNMEQLFEALKTKPFVREDQFLVFSSHIIKSFTVKLDKTKDSRSLSKRADNARKNVFDFILDPSKEKDASKTPKITLDINLNRNFRCADFNAKNVELLVFKKEGNQKDSVQSGDITMSNMQRTGDRITATLEVKNEDPKGNYSYLVYLKANQLNGLTTPRWIQDFSTDNPVPNTPSASKTYNLEKLASTLLVANATVSSTYLAQFYINITKK